MPESWINKKEKEIRDDIVAIAKEETRLTNFKSTGVLRGFIETIARIVLAIYQSAINPIYNNATLDNAKGFFLGLWGLMLGVTRKKAVKAAGFFTGTSYGDGKIKAGTWAVVDGTELRFKVSEEVRFVEDAEFAIPVEAEFPGLEYNIGGGLKLGLTRVITGLSTISVKEDWNTNPGQDDEEDGLYRGRIKSRWRGQILGDPKEVYKFYAEEVDGVRSVSVVRTPRGAGSTDVIVAAWNGNPSEELLQAVRDNLRPHELMAFDVQVKAPAVQMIDVEIEYRGNCPEAEIKLIAERYVDSLGIGGRFRMIDLYDLYEAEELGLATIEIVTPSRDIQPETDAIIEADIKAVNIE